MGTEYSLSAGLSLASPPLVKILKPFVNGVHYVSTELGSFCAGKPS